MVDRVTGCGSLGEVVVQEAHHLRTRAVAQGAEAVVARALRDALGHGPRHGVGIVSRRRNVGERRCVLHSRGAGIAVQERDDLRTGHDHVGAEAVVARALGDALTRGPEHEA